MSEQKRTPSEIAALCRKSKEEIAAKPLFSHTDKCAFLSALVFTAGSLLIHGGNVSVTISTRNDELTRTVSTLAENLTGRACRTAKRGGGTEIVIENALTLLCECRVLQMRDGSITVCEHIADVFLQNPSAVVSYVRGAYLGAGSLTAGKYHLEFSFGRKTLAEDFLRLLQTFSVSGKCTVRAARAVVYVKDSDGISDCLAFMGAAKAVLAFNALLAARQMREQINRRQNCDMHNLDKQVDASARQRALIKETDFSLLSPTLRETAEARLRYPDYTYEELAAKLGITKSGLKNRLRRLTALCEAGKTKSEHFGTEKSREEKI